MASGSRLGGGPVGVSLGWRRRFRDLSGRLSDVPATILDGKATAAALRTQSADRPATQAPAAEHAALLHVLSA